MIGTTLWSQYCDFEKEDYSSYNPLVDSSDRFVQREHVYVFKRYVNGVAQYLSISYFKIDGPDTLSDDGLLCNSCDLDYLVSTNCEQFVEYHALGSGDHLEIPLEEFPTAELEIPTDEIQYEEELDLIIHESSLRSDYSYSSRISELDIWQNEQ